jgi:hypothetical protein
MKTPAVREDIAILRSAEFQQAVNALPGYQTDATGTSQPLSEVAPVTVAPRQRGRSSRG